MKPGHPFFTEEFDELRARQRRDLRYVPEWLVARLHRPLTDLQDQERDGLLELELRALANVQRSRIDDWLQSMKVRTVGEIVAPFFSRHSRHRSVFDRSDPIGRVEQSYFDTARSQGFNEIPEDDEKREALELFILFLTWADDLADDNYADPRLLTGPDIL